jgi:hypothetical protein
MVEATMEMPPEYIEQYRQGYRCLMCHHGPQPEAFPKECIEPFCRFPMKSQQMTLFERMYAGDTTTEPQEVEEELEDLWLPPSAEEGAEMEEPPSGHLWLPEGHEEVGT